VPLHSVIRELSDAGTPVVATNPDGEHAVIYRTIAAQIRDRLQGQSAGRAAPKIVIEA
jgi:ATP-binding protein involved in chromosome partitioning